MKRSQIQQIQLLKVTQPQTTLFRNYTDYIAKYQLFWHKKAVLFKTKVMHNCKDSLTIAYRIEKMLR